MRSEKILHHVLNPEKNDFLLAPLAKKPAAPSAAANLFSLRLTIPDYQKNLRTFDPIKELLEQSPRPDMASSN